MMTATEITLVLIVPIMKASVLFDTVLQAILPSTLNPAIQITTLSRKGQHIKEGIWTELQVFLVSGCFFPSFAVMGEWYTDTRMQHAHIQVPLRAHGNTT